jgi:hypothetical protein
MASVKPLSLPLVIQTQRSEKMHIGVVSPARALRVFLPDESALTDAFLPKTHYAPDQISRGLPHPPKSPTNPYPPHFHPEGTLAMRQLVWA